MTGTSPPPDPDARQAAAGTPPIDDPPRAPTPPVASDMAAARVAEDDPSAMGAKPPAAAAGEPVREDTGDTGGGPEAHEAHETHETHEEVPDVGFAPGPQKKRHRVDKEDSAIDKLAALVRGCVSDAAVTKQVDDALQVVAKLVAASETEGWEQNASEALAVVVAALEGGASAPAKRQRVGEPTRPTETALPGKLDVAPAPVSRAPILPLRLPGTSLLGKSNPQPPRIDQLPAPRPALGDGPDASEKSLQELLEPLLHMQTELSTMMYKVTTSLKKDAQVHWGNLLSQDVSHPSVKLFGRVFTVGRHARADLQLRDPSLSVNVFRLMHTPQRCIIESQSNSSRVAVNGTQLPKREPMVIKSGDEVSVTGASRAYSFILQLLPARNDNTNDPQDVAQVPASASPPAAPVEGSSLAKATERDDSDLAPDPIPKVPKEEAREDKDKISPTVEEALPSAIKSPPEASESDKEKKDASGTQTDKPVKRVRFPDGELGKLPPKQPETKEKPQSPPAKQNPVTQKIAETIFNKHIVRADQVTTTFANMPYSYVSNDLKDLLVSATHVYMTENNISELTDTCLGRSLLLSGDPSAVHYKERLVQALANHYRANLLTVDVRFLDEIQELLSSDEESKDQGNKAVEQTGEEEVKPAVPAPKPVEIEDDDLDSGSMAAVLTKDDPNADLLDGYIPKFVADPSSAKPMEIDDVNKLLLSGGKAKGKPTDDQSLRKLKVGDRVQFVGKTPATGRYDPRKSIHRTVFPLPMPTASTDKSLGWFRGRGSLSSRSSGMQNKGPSPGMRGQVKLTFDQSARVGVCFDDAFAGGHSLGEICEDNHGFFCQSHELALVDEGSTDAMVYDAILDLCNKPENQPIIVYIRTTDHLRHASTFLTKLKKLQGRCVIFGSFSSRTKSSGTGPAPQLMNMGTIVLRARRRFGMGDGYSRQRTLGDLPMYEPLGAGELPAEKEEEKMWMLLSHFPIHMAIQPPSDTKQMADWEKELTADLKKHRLQSNMYTLRKELSSYKVSIEDVDDMDSLSEEILSKESLMRVIGFSVSSRLIQGATRANLLPKKGEDFRNSKELEQTPGSQATRQAADTECKDPEDNGQSHGVPQPPHDKAVAKGVKMDTSVGEDVQTPGSNDTSERASGTSVEESPIFVITKAALERGLELEKMYNASQTPKKDVKDVKTDNDFETKLLDSVVPATEIGVKFDDIGALETTKDVLQEVVMLPLKRPGLFRRGNLAKPCRGVLLFGPPGTGKTMLAKAVATEAGANFFNISMSSITSKWYGEAEKYAKALFTVARKMAPSVIFIDEADSLLGKRDKHGEHEATRKLKNEFMLSWDGLRTTDQERILVLGATNRPFDIDEAALRRFPRRLLVDLPDATNRRKILEVILSGEELDSSVDLEALADELEGYSGSDIRSLCVSAAYRPVKEILAAERSGERQEPSGDEEEPSLRPLNQRDFLEAKSEISASVNENASSIGELRKWNDTYGEGGSRREDALPYFT